MITVSETVEEIIKADEIALEALKEGLLNLSAYSEKIKPLIEKKLIKPVKNGSIIVSLSRIKGKLTPLPQLKPDVIIDDIGVKSPLSELTYEKTEKTLFSASSLLKKIGYQNSFFTITQGINEITIIFPETLREKVEKEFNSKPKGDYSNLVGITVRFSEQEYIEIPNMIYVLVNALASKRINLIEIVSTFSEISFIVRRKDMQSTIEALRVFFN